MREVSFVARALADLEAVRVVPKSRLVAQKSERLPRIFTGDAGARCQFVITNEGARDVD
jgi:hypothetical protein